MINSLWWVPIEVLAKYECIEKCDYWFCLCLFLSCSLRSPHNNWISNYYYYYFQEICNIDVIVFICWDLHKLYTIKTYRRFIPAGDKILNSFPWKLNVSVKLINFQINYNVCVNRNFCTVRDFFVVQNGHRIWEETGPEKCIALFHSTKFSSKEDANNLTFEFSKYLFYLPELF